MATEIEIITNKLGNIKTYTISGHSGYAEAGSDIVCAAVSAIAQTAALGLSEVLLIPIDVTMEDGFFECKLPSLSENVQMNADLILDTMVIGLTQLIEQYPKFLKLNRRYE